MDYKARYITDDIKLSSYEDGFFKSDILFDCHMLVWFISGETKLLQANGSYYFKKGDIFLIPRNQLATIMNYPADGQPHQTVVMHLTTSRLREYYSGLDINIKTKEAPKILQYSNHPLLESCLSSLIPYFKMKTVSGDIASLKIMEAITILRSIDKEIDQVLGNFEEPGKVELMGYMEKNFMFNLPLEKFCYLTGRSLSTFKRDFQKAYNLSPGRWLLLKRLELAHFKLAVKKQKPVDVCYEVGFENLSHFSFAFKKQFGYTPSTASNDRIGV